MQNLHPNFVHFPIAFLVIAIILEVILLFWRRPEMDLTARTLLFLGALGAVLATVSGWYGEQTLAPVAAAHDSIEFHKRLGFLTLGTVAILSFWRAGTVRRGGPRPRWLFVAGMLGLAALLWNTAEEGGELVYEYGVGTELTAPEGPLAEEPTPRDSNQDVPRGEDFR